VARWDESVQHLRFDRGAYVNAGQDPRLFAGEVSDLILG